MVTGRHSWQAHPEGQEIVRAGVTGDWDSSVHARPPSELPFAQGLLDAEDQWSTFGFPCILDTSTLGMRWHGNDLQLCYLEKDCQVSLYLWRRHTRREKNATMVGSKKELSGNKYFKHEESFHLKIRESLILNVFILNSSYGSGKQLLKWYPTLHSVYISFSFWLFPLKSAISFFFDTFFSYSALLLSALPYIYQRSPAMSTGHHEEHLAQKGCCMLS